jgi:hypothetical protein
LIDDSLTDSKHPQDITIWVKPECRKARSENAGDRQVEFNLQSFHFPGRSLETRRWSAEFDILASLLVPNLPILRTGAAVDE